MVSFYALSVQFYVLVSCHVIIKSGNRFHKGLKSSRVISPPSNSSWHIVCLEPLLSCQIYAVSSSRVVVTLE